VRTQVFIQNEHRSWIDFIGSESGVVPCSCSNIPRSVEQRGEAVQRAVNMGICCGDRLDVGFKIALASAC
jgi:hypothetical protein